MNCLDPLKLQAPWEKIKEEQSICLRVPPCHILNKS